MKQHELALYQYDACPFCARVRYFLDEHAVSIPIKDTLLDPAARQELIQIGGKGQVPCLVIDGEPLYESNDIIQWVQDNLLD